MSSLNPRRDVKRAEKINRAARAAQRVMDRLRGVDSRWTREERRTARMRTQRICLRLRWGEPLMNGDE